MRRENTGRTRTVIILSAMTAGLCLLLLLVYIRFDRSRTLYRALQALDSAPLTFSADSGFYEEGFTLTLEPDSSIPVKDGIEIRYTVNGDEPTDESRLYDGGIDLSDVIEELQAEAARTEEKKKEVIRQADAEAEAARLAQEQKSAQDLQKAGDQKAGEEKEPENGEEIRPGLEEGREA
ncbi:MAG: chitobiase/beta-hexosaminidase C-terminal domain-containing protein, partial [Lachnospiraceae bacterium]|nr:chitobiase/beta-hexosaminidase C-terminal domain-containing protein [Lachnospiraceae bacterium]